MTADTQHRQDNTFWIGLLTGAAVGAGLSMWLRPRPAAERIAAAIEGNDAIAAVKS